MARAHLMGVLAALGVAAGLVAAVPAVAAMPPSGRVTTGAGPAFAPIGAPGAAAAARLRLHCGRRSLRTGVRSCHGAGATLQIDGAGRVASWTFAAGRWRTERGVGRGSRVAAVRRAYAGRLRVRSTRRWTYLDLVRTVGGTRRLTRFAARAPHGRVTTLSVARLRGNLLQADAAPTPADRDLVLRLVDFAPRARLVPRVGAPWTGRPLDLAPVRTDRRGNATVVLARAGTLADVLASRPAGTASPVTLSLSVAGGRRTVRAQVALAAGASLTYDQAVMSEAAPGTLTVRSPEPRTAYALTARWTCLDGSADEAVGVSEDPIYSEDGADVAVTVDVGAVRGGLFNADCTGAATPATYPVTLVLSRNPAGPDAEVPGPLDAVAQIRVTLSSAEPTDPA